MIGSEIQQKFFARHTQHAVTLQAIFASAAEAQGEGRLWVVLTGDIPVGFA